MKKQDVFDHLFSWHRRKKVHGTDFTAISNNCFVGTNIYKNYNLPFTSPTIGTYIYGEDYLKLLEHLQYYFRQPLNFIKKSKYEYANNELKKKPFPIALLDDLEIHFIHYKSQTEATEKWQRRVQRINYEKLFVILAQPLQEEVFQREWLERFVQVPFKNKLFITTEKMGHDEITIYVPNVKNFIVGRPYQKYVDLAAWLNGESKFRKTCR